MNEAITCKSKQFFILTSAVTWACWFAVPYFGDPISSDTIFLMLMLMLMLAGLFTPFITALYLIFISKNDALKSTFFNKLLNIKLIKWRAIPLFLILFPASIIVSVLISTLFRYSFDQFTIADEFSFSIGGIPTLLVLLLAACFEELGWRRYAVESLNNKFNYFEATAIFGVLWSLWHLPIFLSLSLIKQNYFKKILF